MLIIPGKAATAAAYADIIEDGAVAQIEALCDMPYMQGCRVRIMPDVHSGKGCVIGFTATIRDGVCPNLVGVDIGCGVSVTDLGRTKIDVKKLDTICHNLPSGHKVWDNGPFKKFTEMEQMHCYRELSDTRRLQRSIGTLGGGNHFIELAQDEFFHQYLLVHTGSRNLGKQVAENYQQLAISINSNQLEFFRDKERLILTYKAEGRKEEIADALKNLRKKYTLTKPTFPPELCCLKAEFQQRYLHDMRLCQEYAALNRTSIRDYICDKLDISHSLESFESVHNYIGDDLIIRKGAVSAYRDEKLIIPINMRDGSLICLGKGNSDWNYSAPHGAGRLMSRTEARKTLSLDDFKRTMKGVYSSTVSQDTIDEAPAAYKPMASILDNIQDTARVIRIIKPLYNFKASE